MTALLLYCLLIATLSSVALLTRVGKLPVFWIFAPWIAAFAPVWLGVVEYTNPPVRAEVAFFVLSHLLIVCFGYAVAFSARRASEFSLKESGTAVQQTELAPLQLRKLEFARIAPVIDGLVLMGCAGSTLFIIDALFVSGFATGDAFETRFNYIESGSSNLGRLAPMLAGGCYVALIAIFWFGGATLGGRLPFYAAAAVSITAFSVLSAGRQAIFQFLLFSLIAWLLTRNTVRLNRTKFKKVIVRSVFALLALAMVWQMVALSSERNSGRIADITAYLLFIFGARLDIEVLQFLQQLPTELTVGLVTGLLYFSSQLSSLAAFLDAAASETWATGFGAYQFPWLYRRFEILGIPSVLEILEFRRDYLRSQGYMSVSWSTSLAVYVNDFGYIASFIYSFCVGLIGGTLYIGYIRNRTFFSFCLLIASYSYLFYMIIFPLSSDTIFFFFVLIVWFLDRRFFWGADRQVMNWETDPNLSRA